MADRAYRVLVSPCDINAHPNGKLREKPLTFMEYFQNVYKRVSSQTLLDIETYMNQSNDSDDENFIPDDALNGQDEDTKNSSRCRGGHLPEYDEIAFWYNKIYFKIQNPLDGSKSFLEKTSRGGFNYLSAEQLIAKENHVMFRDKTGPKKFITEWISTNRCSRWNLEAIEVQHETQGRLDPMRDGSEPEKKEECSEKKRERTGLGKFHRIKCINVFPGMACEYMPGYFEAMAIPFEELERTPAIRWWKRHLYHLFVEPEMRDYFVDFLCHLFQNTHNIPRTYLVLFSSSHGNGKNMLLDVVKLAVGITNCLISAGGKQVFKEDGFSQGRDKLLNIIDELDAGQLCPNVLNALVTQGTCLDNKKYQNPVNITHRARYIFTTNVRDCIFVKPQDRRQVPILCSNTLHWKDNEKNHQVNLKDFECIFGGSKAFSDTSHNEEALAQMGAFFKRRNIDGFNPSNIPCTRFLREVRLGTHTLKFIKTLTVLRYEEPQGSELINLDPYITTYQKLYSGYKYWFTNFTSFPKSVKPMSMSTFEECFDSVVDEIPSVATHSDFDKQHITLNPQALLDSLQTIHETEDVNVEGVLICPLTEETYPQPFDAVGCQLHRQRILYPLCSSLKQNEEKRQRSTSPKKMKLG